MSRATAQLLLLALGALFLLAAALALYPLLPLYHQRARETWQRQQLSHYEIDATWASDWNFGHVRAEVRNNLVVSGIDLETGKPLSVNRMVNAGFFVSVDNLFSMIQQQIRPSPTWRSQFARYHPLLARWLDPCAALMPQITYDPIFGYPSSINYRGTPCFNGANVFLKIERFQPLPE